MLDEDSGDRWCLNDTEHRGILIDTMLDVDDAWIQIDEERYHRFISNRKATFLDIEYQKDNIRLGIPNCFRRRFWLVASGGLDLLDKEGDMYESACAVSQRQSPIGKKIYPIAEKLKKELSDEDYNLVQKFIHVVMSQNRNIKVPPMISTACSMLLLYMEPNLAYACIQAMINRSGTDGWYFLTSENAFMTFVYATIAITKKKVSDVFEHGESIGVDFEYICKAVFPSFFFPGTSLHVSLTFFDCFISEGRKVLVRFFIELLANKSQELKSSTTAQEYTNVILKGLEELSDPTELMNFIHKAFRVRLSRSRHITRAEDYLSGKKKSILLSRPLRQIPAPRPRRHSLSQVFEDLPSMSDLSTPGSIPVRSSISQLQMDCVEFHILTESLYCFISGYFPDYVKHYHPHLCFMLSRDGTSFSNFLSKACDPGSYLLIIKTISSVVGVFTNDSFGDPNRRGYFGSPRCFIFDERGGSRRIFRTQLPSNHRIICRSSDSIAFGGPQPAIFLADGFSHLQSDPSETFGSPTLTISEAGDKIIDLELHRLYY